MCVDRQTKGVISEPADVFVRVEPLVLCIASVGYLVENHSTWAERRLVRKRGSCEFSGGFLENFFSPGL